MSHLTAVELTEMVDTMYETLLGNEIYSRWKRLKQQSNLEKEREFIQWILDIAEASLNNTSLNESREEEQMEKFGGEIDGYMALEVQDRDNAENYVVLSEEELAANASQKEDDSVVVTIDDNQNKSHHPVVSKEKESGATIFPPESNSEAYTSVVETNLLINGDKPVCYAGAGSEAFGVEVAASAMDNIDVPPYIPEQSCSFCLRPCASRADKLHHETVAHGSSASVASSNDITTTPATPSTTPQHFCNFCGRGFTRQFALQRHCKTIHFGIKDLKCSECKQEFGRRDYLKLHMATHHKSLADSPPSQEMDIGGMTMEQSAVNGQSSITDLDAVNLTGRYSITAAADEMPSFEMTGQ